MPGRVGIAALAAALVLVAAGSLAAAGQPTAPTGATAIATDHAVSLAWQPVAGASGYTVYRGTTAASITTLLTSASGVSTASYTDSTAANGTTYYYAVRAVGSGVESANSTVSQATPVARSCSTGNPVVLENCYPGTTSWKLTSTPAVGSGGIEGYATASSVNVGGSIDLKVRVAAGAPYNIEIYRIGSYGGSGARLISKITGLSGVAQPACNSDATTGLYDCSNWSTSATITTSPTWTSGVYVALLARTDNGAQEHVLFVVRDDSRTSDLLYGVPFSTYEAYNSYGGKSLYEFNSSGANTVAGDARAVKVSFNRPFDQAQIGGTHDWFTRSDYPFVSWLEKSGYDVTYQSATDLETANRALGHKAYLFGTHDEYWSSAMRSAVTAARDAGVNLFDSGANSVYWRVRFENAPDGSQNRILVCYKTTQGGATDPVLPTTTWRDPAGANNPENSLLGAMYVGDNSGSFFPFTVPAELGVDRVYRYTTLATQAAGTQTAVGSSLVGWEWDSRVANGAEPPRVKSLAATAVNGNLIQGNGASYTTGGATSNATKYVASSGALVFDTGTNQWARGLGFTVENAGEPDVRIQQMATNVLEDMGARPATAAANITLDNPADPTVTAVTPVDVSSNVALTTDPTVTFSMPMDASTITSSSVHLLYPDGTPAAATVTYDAGTNTATINPTPSLANGVTYTGKIETTVKSASGRPFAIPWTWNFSTVDIPNVKRVNTGGSAFVTGDARSFAADTYFTGGSTAISSQPIANTTDDSLYQNERWGQFSYSIPVANGTYDVSLHFVELYYGTVVAGGCAGKRIFSIDILDTTGTDVPNLDICGAVGPNAALVRTIRNVTVSDGALDLKSIYGSADDPEIAAIEVVPSASAPPPPPAPTVSSTSPATGAIGVSPTSGIAATFSKAMDGGSITTSTFTLKTSAGASVAATVGYDPTTQTATLTPNAALANSTTYTATVTTGVRSWDSASLASAYSWSFTTAAPGAPNPVRVNAGGSAYTTTDGRAFTADQYFTGGSTNSTTHAIAGTNDPSLYQNERWGNFSYAIPVPNGTYDVKLHFVEMYYGVTVAGSCISKRVFSIDIADTPGTDVQNLDVCSAAGGTATAYVRTVSGVTVSDGFLNIQSIYGSADDPEIAAIEVVPSSGSAPPTVTSTAPTSGATNVSPATTVAATFSRAMDATTLTSSTMTLTGPGGASVAATVSYNASTLTATLTPNAQLAANTQYTATVTTGAKAGDGTALASPVAWSFTTAASTGPPTVTSKSPAAGATDVQTSTTVTATFSRAMDATTLTSSTMTLTGAGGASVAATVSYNASSLTATLTPNAQLAANTQYTATVTTGAKAADGTALGSAVTWSFTTAAPIVPGTIRINAGGSAYTSASGVSWSADQYFTGGNTYAITGAIAGTTDQPLYQNERWGQFSYAIPVTNGTYDVKLHFVELYYGVNVSGSCVGKRIFGMDILDTGGQDISGLDICSQAGGPATALVKTISGVTVNDGVLNIQSVYGAADDPELAAIEVIPSSGQVGPPTVTSQSPTPGAQNVDLNSPINAGFSRAMDASTITSSTFTVKRSDGTAVAGTVSYNAGSLTATFVPSAPLDQTTTFTATLTTGVKAADGQALASPVTWSFTSLTPPPNASVVGQWTAPQSWPIVAVHMSLLPNGNVLAFDGFEAAPNSEHIWNPTTNNFTPVPYARNLFCAGHVLLADGRTLIVGGHIAADDGLADTTTYDASTGTWVRHPDMTVGRWYPTATVLGDGRVLVFSGDNIVQNRPGQLPPFEDASVNSLPEVYDPVADTWTDLTNATLTSPLYPFMFQLSDGRILDAGPDLTTRTLTPGSWTWTTIGTSPFDGMSAVMYRPDKIMKSGSWADPDFYGSKVYNATNKTAVLDMTQPSPAWRSTAPMNFARAYHNLTLLPDGTVFASGGLSNSDGIDLTKSVLPTEIWNPTTETWTTTASLTNGRGYHSTAMLLPDGRVLMAGGGRLDGRSPVTDQTNAEIYSPPYLFKGARPTITSAPATLTYGGNFTVTTPDASSISSVALIRTPSVTHAFDQNQRYIPLTYSKNSGSLTVTAPSNNNTAPPGYYLLFIVNGNGVPSVAAFVRFPAPSEDSTPPSAPGTLTATGSLGQVALSWGAATDNVGVARYDVYRSTTSGFSPSLANRIAVVSGTTYTDAGLAAGTYYYLVKAEDAAGNLGAASNQASGTATSDTTAPTVSITAPTAGATVSGTVTVTANASDNVSVAGVQFKLDGNNLGAEDTASPYSTSWDTTAVANGSHTLTAVARDPSGNSTTSTSVTVTVNNTGPPPPPSGLVAAYNFDQGSGTTTPDSSGKGNTGTVSNTTWSTTGKYGGALSFNGTNSYVNIPDSTSLDLTTSMTLEAWVNPSALGTAWRTTILKQNTGALVYALYANTDTGRASGHVFTSSEVDTRATAALTLNAWTHLAATWDGSTLRLYVNGTLASSKAVSGTMANSTGPLRIGGNGIWSEWFKGLIDDVRVYNRALSQSEVQTDMATRVP